MSEIVEILEDVIDLEGVLASEDAEVALETITRLTAEVERFRSLTVVQETLIRKLEAENAKLRAALKKINVGDGWAALIARAALEGK